MMHDQYQFDEYDFFVSYSRADNVGGWVEHFLDALVEEHRRFTGGRTLRYFFDRQDIDNFSDWESEIFHKGLTKSRLFVAFLSPGYFASPACRKEWKAWIDQEIARHILSAGVAPIYFVEVPGFLTKPMLSEHEVAQKVADLCGLAGPVERFIADVDPVLKECRRRQVVSWIQNSVIQPFCHAGEMAIKQEDLRAVLSRLAECNGSAERLVSGCWFKLLGGGEMLGRERFVAQGGRLPAGKVWASYPEGFSLYGIPERERRRPFAHDRHLSV